MRNTWIKRHLFAASAIAGLMAPMMAAAQQNDQAPAMITEIIVTAQRRSETLQQVPVAVSAVGGQEIAARGIKDAADLQFVGPSLSVGSQNGITAVAIRGVGLNQRQGAPGVGIYVDGVYQPHPALGDITQIDLERIEVLRGPQGTLYGRNTTGGAISFISKAPDQEFGGYVLGSVASYDEYRLQGVVNVPLGGSWAARAVANYSDRNEGFIKNVIPGQPDANYGRIWSGRLRVSGDITSNLSLNLEYTGQQTEGPFDYLTISNAPGPFAVAGAPILGTATVTTDKYRTTADAPSDTFRNYGLYAATFNWILPIGDLKSTTSYQDYRDKARWDADGTNVPFVIGNYTNHNTTYVQETLLTSKLGDLTTVAGIFLMRDNAVAANFPDFPTGFSVIPPGGRLNTVQPRYITKAYAAFVDGTWSLSPKLRLIGGARYSVDRQEVDSGTLVSLATPAGFAPLFAICPVNTQTLKFDSFTPRGGAQYDLSDNSNLYGTVSRGFKSGGVNAAGCPNTYAPEKLTAYEFGFKNRLFNRSVILNLSAFYYDYTNIQLEQIVNLAAQITNAAAAKVKGVEVETVWAPDHHWMLTANAVYLDATYDHYVNTDGLNPLAGPQDLSGNRLSYSPKWSLNGGLAYTTDKADWGQLQARADVAYRSRVYFRAFNGPLDSQDPYTLVNLNLQWTAPSDRYSVRLFANNVTNRGYVVTGGSSDTLGTRNLYWGTPRQVGAELRVNF